MLEIKDTESFKKAFDQIAVFIDECNIHINEEGLSISAFDNAQMLYLEFILPKDELNGNLSTDLIGINVVEFNKILSKIASKEKISFDVENNLLVMHVSGIYTRAYYFPLKELEEKKLSIDLNNYDIEFNLKGQILKDIFSSAKTIADSIVFDANENELNLIAEGIFGKYSTKIIPDKYKKIKTKFSSTYLLNMLKALNVDDNVNVKISNDQPLCLSYNIGKTKLRFYLAHMYV